MFGVSLDLLSMAIRVRIIIVVAVPSVIAASVELILNASALLFLVLILRAAVCSSPFGHGLNLPFDVLLHVLIKMFKHLVL